MSRLQMAKLHHEWRNTLLLNDRMYPTLHRTAMFLPPNEQVAVSEDEQREGLLGIFHVSPPHRRKGCAELCSVVSLLRPGEGLGSVPAPVVWEDACPSVEAYGFAASDMMRLSHTIGTGSRSRSSDRTTSAITITMLSFILLCLLAPPPSPHSTPAKGTANILLCLPDPLSHPARHPLIPLPRALPSQKATSPPAEEGSRGSGCAPAAALEAPVGTSLAVDEPCRYRTPIRALDAARFLSGRSPRPPSALLSCPY